MREHLSLAAVAILARDVAAADAAEFRNQYPAYAADIAGETYKALEALSNDAAHRRRYEAFLAAMVYGEKPVFGEAMRTVARLADMAWLGP